MERQGSKARTKRKLVRIIRLGDFYAHNCWSRAKGNQVRASDPEFPHLVEIGSGRFGVREDDAARYQEILRRRAEQPRPIPKNLRNPKAAAAKSAEVRRAKAEQRRANSACGRAAT